MQGTIITLKNDYGFIKGDDNNQYFFHSSDLVNCEVRELVPDRSRVEFNCKTTPKGLRASDVRLVD